MEYIGLTTKFKVNRRLLPEEIEIHCPWNKPSPSPPHHQYGVIRMNSTYLDIQDKYYGWKGVLAAVAVVITGMMGGILIYEPLITDWSTLSGSKLNDEILITLLMWVIASPLLWLNWWHFHKEGLTYTHFPIRFNRKNRMVYVFRQNGTVLSHPWEKLYFVATNYQQSESTWEIRGHVLDEDGKTVLETFALPHLDNYEPAEKIPSLFAQWEFIRRFMEEGPEKLIGQVDHVLDIADRREGFWEGMGHIFGNFAPVPLLALILSPFLISVAIGRWIAIHSSKIPRWPEDVEREC